jgi:hypothetical protein
MLTTPLCRRRALAEACLPAVDRCGRVPAYGRREQAGLGKGAAAGYPADFDEGSAGHLD